VENISCTHFLLLTDKKTTSKAAIAGGVAAGAALLLAAPAITLAWCRRRRPQAHFFDVPGPLLNACTILI
jgi:hypothetical protein